MRLRSRVFLDACYAIALSAPGDRNHEKARALSRRLERDGARIMTTRPVLVEIADGLSAARHRLSALKLLDAIERDDTVEIVPFSRELYERGLALYRDRPDKEWGLTDCMSFVVMDDYGITDALTADRHFAQAGFRALLREEEP